MPANARSRRDGGQAAVRRVARRTALLGTAVVGLAALSSLWNLAGDSVHEWDEARHGQVALEMIQTGDFVNYYFAGQPDDWLVKPPLAIWSIVGSYHLFGTNAFALRFPSALAAVLSVVVLFLLASAYFGPERAALACVMAVTSRGLIGSHVGRTGDTDAMLVLFLLVFASACLMAIDRGRRNAWIIAGLALGLAFYTKGTASLLFLPGVGLYLLFRQKMGTVLRDSRFLLGLAVFGAIVASWYGITQAMGNRFEGEFGATVWDRMWRYDSWHRFTADLEGHAKPRTPSYLLRCLDLRFSPWIYLFYLGAIGIGIRALAQSRRARGNRGDHEKAPRDRARHEHGAVLSGWRVSIGRPSLVAASACIVATFSLFFILSRSKLNWYVAPMIPFLIILTTAAAERGLGRSPVAKATVAVVALVAIVLQARSVSESSVDPICAAIERNRSSLQEATGVLYRPPIHQHHYLCLSWCTPLVRSTSSLPSDLVSLDEDRVLFVPRGDQAEAEMPRWIVFDPKIAP